MQINRWNSNLARGAKLSDFFVYALIFRRFKRFDAPVAIVAFQLAEFASVVFALDGVAHFAVFRHAGARRRGLDGVLNQFLPEDFFARKIF